MFPFFHNKVNNDYFSFVHCLFFSIYLFLLVRGWFSVSFLGIVPPDSVVCHYREGPGHRPLSLPFIAYNTQLRLRGLTYMSPKETVGGVRPAKVGGAWFGTVLMLSL